MTDKTQPEALRLADWLDTHSNGQLDCKHKAAAELRRQHTRIAELEAELEAVGAGGVQALSAAPVVHASVKGAMWFTKKPVTIQAIQWTGDNLREVITFTDGPPDTRSHHAGMAWDAYRDLVARDGFKIYTLEGKMLASPGDWIIRGVKGELYPCKPDIFQETYAAASPTPPAEQQAMESVLVDGAASQPPISNTLWRMLTGGYEHTYILQLPNDSRDRRELIDRACHNWRRICAEIGNSAVASAVSPQTAQAPQQTAPKAAPAWEHHARKLTQWLHCMSHNDSYFGEPAGLVKQVTGELNRLIGAAPQQEAQEPYPIDADPQGIRAVVADAITGALAFGAQGANPPPEGHWLTPFWGMAREEAMRTQPAPAPLIARSLAEWHEQDGNVAWWAWNGREWAGEPAWIGTPNCEDWPGYHTHWTPHPEQPVCAALAAQGGKDA